MPHGPMEEHAGARTSRGVFASRAYRWLFGSNLAFYLALQSQALVRGFLAFQLTGSEFALGSVSFAVAVPMLLIAPIGGVLADRVDRRGLILGAQGLVLISESTVLSLYATGHLEFWHLLAVSFAMGFVFPLVMPARQAIVANLVDRELLSRAVALNTMSANSARVVGPALGGLLILGNDVRLAYAVGITIHLAALLGMVRIGAAPPPAGARDRSPWSDLVGGFEYLRQNRLIALLLGFGLLPMFLALPFQQLLPAFTEKVWPVGSNGLGLLSAAVGSGGVVGSAFVAWRSHRARQLGLQLTSMFLFGPLLVAFCWAPHFSVALPLAFLGNVFASVFGTVNSTTIQLLIPDHVRGRVSSFLMMSFSLPLLGVFPVSYLASQLGLRQAVSGAAILATLCAGLFWLISPTLRGVDRAVGRTAGSRR